MKRILVIILLLMSFNLVNSQITLDIDNIAIREHFTEIILETDSLISNDLVSFVHGDGEFPHDYIYKFNDQKILKVFEDFSNNGIYSEVCYYQKDNQNVLYKISYEVNGIESFLYLLIRFQGELYQFEIIGRPDEYQDRIDRLKKELKEYEP